jgi:hypothetical protein
MGMGMMDALARALGNGGGPSAPVSKPLIQALLAKHGTAAPTSTGAVIDKPNLDMPAPVDIAAGPMNAPSSTGAIASLPDANIKKPGLFDRMGDFLHSDEGRAALLRSGAATLQGGLGAGIQAGADFVDRRRAQAAAAAQNAAEMAMRGKQIDNSYNLGLGHLDVDATNSAETSRHNRAGEGTERSRIWEDYQKHINPSGDARLRVAEDRFQHITPSGDTQTTQAGENYRHDTTSADNTQDNQTQLMRDRLAAAPKINMHAHYTTTPEEFARNGPRLRASQVQPQSTGAAEVRYDDSGQAFVRGPDGSAVRAPQYDRR